jgi:hypothetical protein
MVDRSQTTFTGIERALERFGRTCSHAYLTVTDRLAEQPGGRIEFLEGELKNVSSHASFRTAGHRAREEKWVRFFTRNVRLECGVWLGGWMSVGKRIWGTA